MFYDRFVALCADRKVSPSRAAVEAGLSKSIVTRWKKGPESELSGTAIKKLSDYFGVSKAELLGESENTPATKSPEVSESDIIVALFGAPDVTEAQFEEVRQFARFVRERDAQKKL